VSPSWEKVFAVVAPSVVSIQVSDGQSGDLGSGFILNKSGQIMTNNHVIAPAVNSSTAQIVVTLSDGRVFEAKIKGTDATSDLAVIELQNSPDDLQPVEFADSNAIVVGDPIMAVGNPLGLSNTATTGVISALDRPVAATSDDGLSNSLTGNSNSIVVTNALQLDASINPGNSGGPLFDRTGKVIGVTSSIATTSSSSGSIGLGFAIPANLAHQISEQIISTGKAVHVSLGVTIVDDSVKVDGVTRKAALIKSITENSPAQKAGLKEGDYIVSVDDRVVSSTYSLMGYIREYQLNSKANVSYVRSNKIYTASVVLDQEQQITLPKKEEKPSGSNDQEDPGTWDPWGLFGGEEDQDK
jgi:putative serine protease PepD